MYRYNYDYQASVEEFLNFKWTLVELEQNIFAGSSGDLPGMPGEPW